MTAAIQTTASRRRSLRDAAEAFSDESMQNMNEMEARVLALAKAKRDAVVHTPAFVAMTAPAAKPASVEYERQPIDNVILHAASQSLSVAVGDLAHDQLADRTGIPRDYYRRMLEGQPELLAQNINTWFQKEPDKRLFRLLTPTTDLEQRRHAALGTAMTLRGVLGATYRKVDNAELVAAVLPVAREHGAFLKKFDLDERRLHAQFVTMERSIQSIREAVAQRHGEEAAQLVRDGNVHGRSFSFIDEVIRAGFSMRNSEVGFASLEVASFLDILKCLNGMIVPASTRVRHAGKRNEVDDGSVEWLSSATQQLDNAALMSRARDAALAALDERSVVKLGNTVLAAKTEQVALDGPLFDWIDHTSEKLGLNETQVALYKEETTRAVVQEGGQTKFALVQGLTALARQQNDFDKRTELERTGWQWLEGSTADLVKLGKEATRRRGSKN